VIYLPLTIQVSLLQKASKSSMPWGCAHRNQADKQQEPLLAADSLESAEAEEKVLFFEYAERETVEDKMEEFITKSGLLKDWTYAFYTKDGNKVQEENDVEEDEHLWPLKVVFTKKAPKPERKVKTFPASRYENLSPGEKLHAAACDDNVPLIEELAKEGVDLNEPRQDGGTALDACAWSGSLAGAEALLRHGADPAATVQALAGAASWGHTALLEMLLAKGGKVNQEHGNFTSLRWAIEMGHEDCAVVLQKYDAISKQANQAGILKRARHSGMREFLQAVADMHPELAQDCVIRAGDRCAVM
jgi:hypothetical protein